MERAVFLTHDFPTAGIGWIGKKDMARRIYAWMCRYCGDIKKTRNVAEKHEIACLKNPNARNCMHCIYSFEGVGGLKCEKGKKCTKAVSAVCPYFTRKK